jgi:hypothetical protein
MSHVTLPNVSNGQVIFVVEINSPEISQGVAGDSTHQIIADDLARQLQFAKGKQILLKRWIVHIDGEIYADIHVNHPAKATCDFSHRHHPTNGIE